MVMSEEHMNIGSVDQMTRLISQFWFLPDVPILRVIVTICRIVIYSESHRMVTPHGVWNAGFILHSPGDATPRNPPVSIDSSA